MGRSIGGHIDDLAQGFEVGLAFPDKFQPTVFQGWQLPFLSDFDFEFVGTERAF